MIKLYGLLAYSGGEVDKKSEGINYCQFIGIDKTTGDTIRLRRSWGF